MACLITCGFARVAVRENLRKHANRSGHLNIYNHESLLQDYNDCFADYLNMQLSGESKYLTKKFKELNATFSQKWPGNIKPKEYCEAFSMANWQKLPNTEKYRHSLHECSACPLSFPELEAAFPVRSPGAKGKRKQSITCSIEVTEADLQSPPTKIAKKLGHDIVTQLSPICQEMTGMPLSKVLALTPTSGTTERKSRSDQKRDHRQRMRDVKQTLQQELRNRDSKMLFHQRLSYRKYNAIRLTESFESIKEATERTVSNQTKIQSKRHGLSQENIPFDAIALLAEANQWSENAVINWTDLANRYGVVGGNRGQIVKEYLAKKGVPAARKRQRNFIRRAQLKLPGGEIRFPTHMTVQAQKAELQKKIQQGEILIGEILPPVQFTRFSVDKQSHSITETKVTVHGRKIPLLDIRKKILKHHEELGLLRVCTEGDSEILSPEQLEKTLNVRKIYTTPNASHEEKIQLLLQCSKRRCLKIWHDHGKIAGQSYMLILVSSIYDPAVYYTPEELVSRSVSLDVTCIVELPEIHFISRCGSSDAEQFMLNEFRTECVQKLSEPIYTTSGQPMYDTLRFFHGDGPAQQFEAGQSRGGEYPCVACETSAYRFDDICYSYRCRTIPIEARQQFMLKGIAWQRGGFKPLDGLSKPQLHHEIQAHGSNTTPTMTKLQLQQEFHALRKGITNFPALLTSNPKTGLQEINLHHYEISACEPLHDFKGHMANLVGEIKEKVTGETKNEVNKIISATLGKDTLRCVDYRKTAILLSNALHEMKADQSLCGLIDTVVEICQLMYAREDVRSPRAILRLHNLTLLHAAYCIEVLGTPKKITKRKMFGRYFHAMMTHAASMYRLVALRSLNTEMQERLFNLCNDITKTTSNRQSSHLINNIIIRIQQESDGSTTTLKKQEGEVATLASALKPPSNTVVTKEWVQKHPYLWQAHLERISDYLVHGPGVWWKYHSESIEFIDGPDEDDSKCVGPPLHHFRSVNLKEEEAYLEENWDICIRNNIPLPLCTPKVYNSEGDLQLQSFESSPEQDVEQHEACDDIETVTDIESEVIDIREEEIDTAEKENDENDPPCMVQTSSTSQAYDYQTKLCKQLAKVIGTSRYLQTFDKLRKDFKANKESQRHGKNLQKYEKCRNAVCRELTAKVQQLSTKIKDWEREYLQIHCIYPSPECVPQHIAVSMRDKRTIIKIVGHEWNIQLM